MNRFYKRPLCATALFRALTVHACKTASWPSGNSQADDKDVLPTSAVSATPSAEMKQRRGSCRTDRVLARMSSEWTSKKGGRAGCVLAGSMAGLRTPQSMADEECLLRSRRRNAGDTDSDTRWGRDASPWPVSCWSLLQLHELHAITGKLSSKFFCPSRGLSFAPGPGSQSGVCYRLLQTRTSWIDTIQNLHAHEKG